MFDIFEMVTDIVLMRMLVDKVHIKKNWLQEIHERLDNVLVEAREGLNKIDDVVHEVIEANKPKIDYMALHGSLGLYERSDEYKRAKAYNDFKMIISGSCCFSLPCVYSDEINRITASNSYNHSLDKYKSLI